MDLEDRCADVWEGLLAVADLAGGHWPTLARAAATKLTTQAANDDTENLGVQLLHDLREVYRLVKGDWVPTDALLIHLRQLDGAPWADMNLTSRRMGDLLGEFAIKSERNKEHTKRGYTRAAFADAWERYPPRNEQSSQDQSGDKQSGEDQSGNRQPGEASKASGSVRTPSDQQKHPDASVDALDALDEASGKASGHRRRSDPIRTLRDASDALPGRNRCQECGRAGQSSLLAGLCRRCHFPSRAVS